MDSLVTSFIRTYVPIAVGAGISWLALERIEIDAETQTALAVGLTGVLQSVYYTAVRTIALKWPSVEILLGRRSQPEYTD